LRAPHADRAGVEVDVLPLERGRLTEAHARPRERADQRPRSTPGRSVALPLRRVDALRLRLAVAVLPRDLAHEVGARARVEEAAELFEREPPTLVLEALLVAHVARQRPHAVDDRSALLLAGERAEHTEPAVDRVDLRAA